METALTKLSDQGLVGVLLVLAITAIAFLYRTNQALNAQMREDARTLTTAAIESASALREVTKVVDQNTAVVRELAFRMGGK